MTTPGTDGSGWARQIPLASQGPDAFLWREFSIDPSSSLPSLPPLRRRVVAIPSPLPPFPQGAPFSHGQFLALRRHPAIGEHFETHPHGGPTVLLTDMLREAYETEPNPINSNGSVTSMLSRPRKRHEHWIPGGLPPPRPLRAAPTPSPLGAGTSWENPGWPAPRGRGVGAAGDLEGQPPQRSGARPVL